MGTFARRKCCLFNFFLKIPRNRRFFIGCRVDLVKIGGDFFSIARFVAMVESRARVSPSATSARRRRDNVGTSKTSGSPSGAALSRRLIDYGRPQPDGSNDDDCSPRWLPTQIARAQYTCRRVRNCNYNLPSLHHN